MVDLREGLGGPRAPPPHILGKKKKSQKEEKPVGQATKKPLLAQGLDPPLINI